MNTAESIYEDVKQLSEPMLQELVHFIGFLKFKNEHSLKTNEMDIEYQLAKQRTLQRMRQGYHLGGKMPTRESLYDR